MNSDNRVCSMPTQEHSTKGCSTLQLLQSLSTRMPPMLFLILLVALVSGCTAQPSDPGAVTIAIEQPPLNFDPRVATDVTSQRASMLMFSALVKKKA